MISSVAQLCRNTKGCSTLYYRGWLLKLMMKAVVDTKVSKAHSMRGALTSKAAAKGLHKDCYHFNKYKINYDMKREVYHK